MRAMKILVVDDERAVRESLRRALELEGYEVELAGDGEEALERLIDVSLADAVILDVLMPGIDGLEVCRRLRAEGNEVPVLMLTARGQVADRVVGLKLGADDYLTKPFEVSELLARVEARVRRGTGALNAPESYRFGDVRVDFRKTEVEKEGQSVELSAKEFHLLKYLIEHRGATVTRNELLDAVWGYDAMPTTRTVDVHVAWLRKKVEASPRRPQFILTVHGVGYKFVG